MVSWRPSIGILVKDETLQTRRDETETDARSCSDGSIRSSVSRATNDPSVFTIMEKSPTLLALSHLRHTLLNRRLNTVGRREIGMSMQLS